MLFVDQSALNDKPFVHEEATHLFHTEFYDVLNEEQKLCYNQLFGLMVCEQFFVFEHNIMEIVCGRILKKAKHEKNEPIIKDIAFLMKDENRHAKTFSDHLSKFLKVEFDPKVRCFTKTNFFMNHLLKIISSSMLDIRSYIWYVLAIEEHSVSFGEMYTENKETQLGKIDKTFRDIQLKHKDEEVHHLPLEGRLIEYWYDGRSEWRKKTDMKFLNYWLNLMRTPKIAGIAVIDQLLAIYPSLSSHSKVLKNAILNIRMNHSFQSHFIGPEDTPFLWNNFKKRTECKTIMSAQGQYA